MPPRDPALPEGTDHIIQGAAGSSGSAGGSTSETGGGGASSGFVASGGGGDDTGGTAGRGAVTTASGSGSESGEGSGTERVREQIRNQVYSLRDQATGKARELADDGKSRATTLLDDFRGVIDDAARAIEDRFGADYAGYARRASSSVGSLSETLRGKEVDELLDDTRNAIRRSPGIAIGIAAVVGFALVRVLKTGMEDMSSGSGESGRKAGGSRGGGNGGS